MAFSGSIRSAALASILACFCAIHAPAHAQTEDDLDAAMELIATDPEAAKAQLEALAESGDAEALNAVAMLLSSNGPSWQADPETATKLREEALAAGSKGAAVTIATHALLVPDGDHARAIDLLHALQGDDVVAAVVEHLWARAYLFGWGVEQDLALGVEHVRSAVALDPQNADAQFLLARAYENGWSIEPDAELAFSHMQLAVVAGDHRAPWRLGMMLLEGRGAEVNEALAYQYVRQSAEAGYTNGMVSLAVMLATGQGVAENDEEALEWYLTAASLGSAHALRGLGAMLALGEGGVQDAATGIAMVELANETGEPGAPSVLEYLAQHVSAERDDIDTAKREWVAEFGLPFLDE